MLKKEICWKCHECFNNLNGKENPTGLRCYPLPTADEAKQCRDQFEKEWGENKVFCFGIQNEASDKEMKEMFGEKNWNMPFINPLKDKPSKYCYFKKEYVTKSNKE